MTGGLLAGCWDDMMSRTGLLLPRLRQGLGGPLAPCILLSCLGLWAVFAAFQGKPGFALFGAAAVLAHVLIRRDALWGFFLIGLFCALVPKIFLPWPAPNFIFLRMDDVLLLLLLMKLAGNPWKRNMLDTPILLFLLLALLSLVLGVWMHCVDKPWYTFFNFLKWGQYFLWFALAYQMPDPMRGVRFFGAGILVSLALILPFGLWEHFHPLNPVVIGDYYRLFERPPFLAQANHFGVFFALCLCAALPFFAMSLRPWLSLLLLGFCLTVVTMQYWTYSRTSYLALIAGFGLMCLLGKKRVLWTTALCIVLAPLLFSPSIQQRTATISESFHGTRFSSSTVSRFTIWKEMLPAIKAHPVLGTGIGSRNRVYYDSFWMQLLAETGIVGFVLYALGILGRGIIFLLGKTVQNVSAPLRIEDAVTLGFFGITAAMVVAAIPLVVFAITMLAIPYWIMFGLVLRNASPREMPCPA